MKSHRGQSSREYSPSKVSVSLAGWNHLGVHFSLLLSRSCTHMELSDEVFAKKAVLCGHSLDSGPHHFLRSVPLEVHIRPSCTLDQWTKGFAT